MKCLHPAASSNLWQVPETVVFPIDFSAMFIAIFAILLGVNGLRNQDFPLGKKVEEMEMKFEKFEAKTLEKLEKFETKTMEKLEEFEIKTMEKLDKFETKTFNEEDLKYVLQDTETLKKLIQAAPQLARSFLKLVPELTGEKREKLLHEAARGGYEKVVEALLKAGAQVEAKDKDGKTLLHRAAWKGDEKMV